jgi:hypothetical protein
MLLKIPMPGTISKSARFFVFLFSLPFLLIGAFGVYKFLDILLWSGSGGTPYPFLLYGVVFGVAGLIINILALGGKKRVAESSLSSTSAPDDDEEVIDSDEKTRPWRCYDQWKDGKVECDSQGRMIGLWIGAVALLGISVPILLQLRSESERGGISTYLPLFLPLAGLLLLFLAIQATFRWRKFGKSVFTIRNETGVVGGVLAGSITTSRALQTPGPYSFKLACKERITKGTGKNRQVTTHWRWSADVQVPSAGYNSQAGVPVSIQVPADCLETGDDNAQGVISWQLSVRAPVQGVDYYAEFEVPVFKRRG